MATKRAPSRAARAVNAARWANDGSGERSSHSAYVGTNSPALPASAPSRRIVVGGTITVISASPARTTWQPIGRSGGSAT